MKVTVLIASIFTLILLGLVVLPLSGWEADGVFLFMGNLHPLALHIPIGALLAVLVLEGVNMISPKLALENASKVLLWFSAFSTAPAVIFGFFLASGGGYNQEIIAYHQWLGWSTALLCVWLLVFRLWAYAKSKALVNAYRGLLFINIILLSLAGHYGGSLTHGPDYLTKDMPDQLKAFLGVEYSSSKQLVSQVNLNTEEKPEESALVFINTIQPLMEKNCFDCHNANKQKGDMRLDNLDYHMDSQENTDLWNAILYELEERNMPPEEKEPLTNKEYESIITWIKSGLEKAETIPIIDKEPSMVLASSKSKSTKAAPTKSDVAPYFLNNIQPILKEYCYGCHGSKRQKGGVRLDILNQDMITGDDAEKWHAALDEINAGNMPPRKKPQLSEKELETLTGWLTSSLKEAAKANNGNKIAKARRLTKAQYTNTLIELLKLPINFGNVLPDDGKSKSGFGNDAEILQVSPLHIDYYQKIAREALDKVIVSDKKPKPIRYKVTFGEGIGKDQPSAEFKGYQTAAIKSDNFIIDILDKNGSPIVGHTEKEKDSIFQVKKLIGVGMRGSSSDRYGVTTDGMIMYSAIPHKEVPPRSWQGPSPNMKLLIKDNFPQSGNFVFRVEASKGSLIPLKEGLIALRKDEPAAAVPNTISILATSFKNKENLSLNEDGYLVPLETNANSSAKGVMLIPEPGFYQIDMVHPYTLEENMPSFRINIGKFRRVQERLRFTEEQSNEDSIVTPITLAYLKEGEYNINIGGRFFIGFSQLLITPLPNDNPVAVSLMKEAEMNLKKYEGFNPSIRVFAGSRTDDGMDYSNFGITSEVKGKKGDFITYEFEGQLENLPIPDFDIYDNNPLSNTMNLGLWNNYLVKDNAETGPPLLIRSIELESPYYSEWPPESHTNIFFESPSRDNEQVYTAEVLMSFMEKAFRRPVLMDELNRYLDFWEDIRYDYDRYEDGVKEVLIAVLCSPSFMYILEDENPESIENDDQYLLASKLSYFLWNSPPDKELKDLARLGRLRDELPNQISRMTKSEKVMGMVNAFAYDWLRLDRLKTMNTNVKLYPDFTHFVKEDMENETYYFIHRLLQENMSILNFIDSDFAMLNQNLAEFYGIEGVIGSEFRPVAVAPDKNRGGLLSQGAFLTGHSDGVQAHPIKRAVWLKEKILGDTPPPPPPNVPELDPETPGFENLTLKEQLEIHRNKPSCVSCHLKIDPYGVVFENYDAVGRYKLIAKNKPIDAVSELPDGTTIDGVQGIKDYIRNFKRDQFAKAFVEHLYTYALGREVGFSDEEAIESIALALKTDDYRIHTAIEQIVLSNSFSHYVN